MPMLFPRPICGLQCNQFRCCAAAVGGVRKYRTLTPHPLVGSRLRSCDRKCDVPLTQEVAASLIANVII